MLTCRRKYLRGKVFLIIMGRTVEEYSVKKILITLVILSFFLVGCQKEERPLYTLGIFQVNEAPTLNAVREGFIHALEEKGLINGENVRLVIRNGQGDISRVQQIAEGFVAQDVDMVVAFSTPCLQAALHATRNIPIVFSSVANPYLAGAGASAEDHLSNVSGVSSEGPIKQSLLFIKQLLPHVKRIGTLWTPSELNSNYYLEIAREGAAEIGLEVVAVPITHPREVLLSAQILINKKIDVIYQISDNTINNSFEALGQVATENSVPLFGGFLVSTQLGACAALGWDFFDMGHKAGVIAVRVKNGESPADIPIQYMNKVLLNLNIHAAKRQGIEFPEEILSRADKVLYPEEVSGEE